MKKTVLLDLDDTVVACGKNFHAIKMIFAEFMANRTGISVNEMFEAFTNFDVERAKIYMSVGYDKTLFGKSMRNFYEVHVGKPTEDEEKYFDELGLSVFELDYPLLEGALEAIKLLHSSCDLFLISMGDPEIQMRKVSKAGIGHYFKEIRITHTFDKSTAINGIINKYGYNKSTTYMVGDNLLSDITSAIKAGVHSIYIPTKHVWIAPDNIAGQFHTFDSITEASHYILNS